MTIWVALVIGVISFFTTLSGNLLAAWLRHRGMKELEQQKPLTAEETLRRELHMRAKVDAYYEAVGLVARTFQCADWTETDPETGVRKPRTDRVAVGERPTEAELNTALAKLAMFTQDLEILALFARLVASDTSPPIFARFIARLRTELGSGEAPFKEELYPLIFQKVRPLPATQLAAPNAAPAPLPFGQALVPTPRIIKPMP